MFHRLHLAWWVAFAWAVGCQEDKHEDNKPEDTGTSCAPAEEIPYDGVDQDCDGADLTDVDEDGYDAAEVGGPDCDDSDSAIHPGVPEVQGDGVDNDCDGRGDEYVVCADGTGDFTTVQEGIDDAPRTAVLELCPGVYEEDLDLTGKDIDIEGGGECPGDVILRGVSENYHITTGVGTATRLYWLAMESNGGGAQRAILLEDPDTFTVDTVELCSSTGGYTSFMEGTCDRGAEVGITRSRICDELDLSSAWPPLTVENGCSFTFSLNVVTSPAVIIGWFDVSHGRVSVTNNLFSGGEYYFGGEAENEGEETAVFHVGHNTFADLSGLMFVAFFRDLCSTLWPWDFQFSNNIFSTISTDPRYGLWYAYIQSPPFDGFAELLAPEFTSNLLWSVEPPFGSVSLNALACSHEDNEGDSTIVSEMMASASILADPLFTADPAMGSYALDPTSPAVDAGEGDRDSDGSRADLGAFGGPNGDWWQDVPWTLP